MSDKHITVIFPALEKYESPEEKKYTFETKQDYRDFCNIEKGALFDGDSSMSFNNLKSGAVYLMGGGFRKSILTDTNRRQAEAKVLEVECGLATQRTAGGDAHIHSGVMFKGADGKDVMELDNVLVHSLKENIPNATAYIVECTYSPQQKEVDILLNKVETFKKLAPANEHFRNCTKFVPVLGGRNWPKATLDLCTSKKVSTVTPTGMGYKLNRAFCTLLRRLPK